MKKITPEMLGSEAKAIEVPEYDWEKQSRINAWGTTNWTNSGYWTNNPPPFGRSYDSSSDSISD